MEHLDGLAWTKSRLQVFVDSQMLGGDKFKEKIANAIQNTSVGVFLVSPNFMKSTFIQQNELKPLMERHERTGMPIVPVVVEPCAWKETSLANFLVRPTDGQPLALVPKHERKQTLVDIALEINHLYVQQFESSEEIRLLIADDQEFAVLGLRDLFEDVDDINVIGLCRTATEVEKSVQKLVPDIILLDLSWYRIDTTGLRLIETIRQISPTTKIIPISNYPELIEDAKALGTQPLDKGFTMHELFEHIRKVHDADPVVENSSSQIEQLTDRETEILALIGQGETDKEIAQKLVISTSTVKKHVGNILKKTGARTRAEAAVKAANAGVI